MSVENDLRSPVADIEMQAAIRDRFQLHQLLDNLPPEQWPSASGHLRRISTTLSESSPWRTLRWSERERIFRDRLSRPRALAEALASTRARPNQDRLHDLLEQVVKGRLRPDAHPAGDLRLIWTLRAYLPREHASTYALVKATLDRTELVESYRRHVGDAFVGRQQEIKLISRFLGFTRSAEIGDESRFLLLTGIGGIGKSALMLKVLLHRLSPNGEPIYPIAYLDFDRPGLMGSDCIPVLLEIVKQITVWYPGKASHFDQIVLALRRYFASNDLDGQLGSDLFMGDDAQPLERTTVRAVDLVGQACRAADIAKLPFVLMFDTVEELLFKEPDLFKPLISIAIELATYLPELRVIISSRALPSPWPEKKSPVVLELGELSTRDSIEFLRRHDIPSDLAKQAINNWGRHTLTLHLLVDLYRRHPAASELLGPDWIDSEASISFELQQLILFDRIVSHIHDWTIRRITRPIFIPRFLTRDLIDEIISNFADDEDVAPIFEDDGLAGEASLSGTGHDVFDLLRREFAVVEQHDDMLTIRPSLRRAVLPIILEADPSLVAELSGRLIPFCRARADRDRAVDPASALRWRAEEIYHRLAVGRDLEAVLELGSRALRPHLLTLLDDPAIKPGDPSLCLSMLLDRRPQERDLRKGSPGIRRRALLQGARLELARGRPAEAELILRQPDLLRDAEGRLLLGRALLEGGQWRAAQAVLASFVARDEERQTAMGVSVRSDLAYAVFNSGDFRAAWQISVSESRYGDRELNPFASILKALIGVAACRLMSDSAGEERIAMRISDECSAIGAEAWRTNREAPRLLRRLGLLLGGDPQIACLVLRHFPWTRYRASPAERHHLRDALRSRDMTLAHGFIEAGRFRRASQLVLMEMRRGNIALGPAFLSIFSVRHPEWIVPATRAFDILFDRHNARLINLMYRHNRLFRERMSEHKSRLGTRRIVQELDAEGLLLKFIRELSEGPSVLPASNLENGLGALLELNKAAISWSRAVVLDRHGRIEYL